MEKRDKREKLFFTFALRVFLYVFLFVFLCVFLYVFLIFLTTFLLGSWPSGETSAGSAPAWPKYHLARLTRVGRGAGRVCSRLGSGSVVAVFGAPSQIRPGAGSGALQSAAIVKPQASRGHLSESRRCQLEPNQRDTPYCNMPLASREDVFLLLASPWETLGKHSLIVILERP